MKKILLLKINNNIKNMESKKLELLNEIVMIYDKKTLINEINMKEC